MISVHDLLWFDALLFGAHRDRSAVNVRPRHHQHVVPGQSVEAGEDVGGQVRPAEMPEMARTRRIRPCDGNEDVSRF